MLAGQRVVHARAVATGADEAGAEQELQVLAGVGDALADLAGEVLDAPLTLRQHVDELGAPAVAERIWSGGPILTMDDRAMRASPKSETTTRPVALSIKMFPGVRSRWTMPRICA